MAAFAALVPGEMELAPVLIIPCAGRSVAGNSSSARFGTRTPPAILGFEGSRRVTGKSFSLDKPLEASGPEIPFLEKSTNRGKEEFSTQVSTSVSFKISSPYSFTATLSGRINLCFLFDFPSNSFACSTTESILESQEMFQI